MKNVLVVFATLVVSGCAMVPPSPAGDALVTLETGGCGFIAACPAYTISMKPDGSYHYEGFRNVPLIGVRDGQLPAGSWENADAAFMAAGWKNIENPTTRESGYPCMPDSPFARITRRVRAGEEKVFDYSLGCDSKSGSVLLGALSEILQIPTASAQ
jgi:hypothetical protein